MDEIRKITEKYDEAFVREGLNSLEGINKFALTFYKDVAEIYDCFTRIKNVERNPTGFALDDAPVLGLLVRIWKLLKEIIKYYEQDRHPRTSSHRGVGRCDIFDDKWSKRYRGLQEMFLQGPLAAPARP
jgi:hypothetical protein